MLARIVADHFTALGLCRIARISCALRNALLEGGADGVVVPPHVAAHLLPQPSCWLKLAGRERGEANASSSLQSASGLHSSLLA